MVATKTQKPYSASVALTKGVTHTVSAFAKTKSGIILGEYHTPIYPDLGVNQTTTNYSNEIRYSVTGNSGTATINVSNGDYKLLMKHTKDGSTYLSTDGEQKFECGTGEKPKFYGHIENLADPALWEEYDSENHIWKYTKMISNPGTLVFDEGKAVARNHIPSFRNLGYVCRYDETKPFVIENELTNDLDLFWHFDRFLSFGESKGEKFPVPDVGRGENPLTHTGDLYLRCDKGNPGDVFESIEAVAYLSAFKVPNRLNVTVDNLCIKYYCFAVAGGGAKGLHVTNCEIGWIGGNIQNFDGNDPNYPEGKRGSVTRYGNGIEIYGSCHDYIVSNCYIYQSYDAGASHQACIARKMTMTKVRYTDNVIEKCVYGIEYFLDSYNKDLGSYMDDIIISGNIIRLSGYGWGQQRHNVDTPALVKVWSYENPASNFSIYNNVFDRAAYRMLHLVARKAESCPKMHDNTYIQHLGGMIGQYGANEVKEPAIEIFDENAEEKILNIFGDKNAKVYVIE